jgi:hypothetical protein
LRKSLFTPCLLASRGPPNMSETLFSRVFPNIA